MLMSQSTVSLCKLYYCGFRRLWDLRGLLAYYYRSIMENKRECLHQVFLFYRETRQGGSIHWDLYYYYYCSCLHHRMLIRMQRLEGIPQIYLLVCCPVLALYENYSSQLFLCCVYIKNFWGGLVVMGRQHVIIYLVINVFSKEMCCTRTLKGVSK